MIFFASLFFYVVLLHETFGFHVWQCRYIYFLFAEIDGPKPFLSKKVPATCNVFQGLFDVIIAILDDFI